MPTPSGPTLAGFTAWVFGVMGVPTAWLPSDSPALEYAYWTARATVNPAFQCVPNLVTLPQDPQPPQQLIYSQMVYNLGGHLLATWAPDPSPFPGNPPAPWKTVDGVPYGFFAYLRKENNILGFTTGIVSSSGDEGTNAAMVVPKQAENLTLSQLQLTSTFWGRWYLGQAQAFGTNWGIS